MEPLTESKQEIRGRKIYVINFSHILGYSVIIIALTWLVLKSVQTQRSLDNLQGRRNQILLQVISDQAGQIQQWKTRYEKAERLAIGSGPPIIGDVICVNDGPLVCHVLNDAEFDDIVADTLDFLHIVLSASWDFKEPCSLGMEALALANGKKCLGYWERKEPLPRSLPPP